MAEIDGFELPARKSEFLKVVSLCGGTMRTNEVAHELNVSPSTATKVLADLAREGYLEHTPYHGVCLTAKGEEYSRFLVRRHRIVSLALSRFGLSPDEACQEAKNLEGHVSRALVDRICASLGHPVMSGCGPIEHDGDCCPCGR
ncbi:metal-dependent transcriptional regulator [uncultured Methanofollis sp.]|uniref:metal-dependent transcriptional regulator n=1 Tax=uncultured Methanofollis sp. TaxID=262500 RepID=UPI0026302268|nr:metal-dependent transcriptional regulator [uncultured Methanofollis sp.]